MKHLIKYRIQENRHGDRNNCGQDQHFFVFMIAFRHQHPARTKQIKNGSDDKSDVDTEKIVGKQKYGRQNKRLVDPVRFPDLLLLFFGQRLL